MKSQLLKPYLFTLLFFAITSMAGAQVLYVDQSAAGSNNGSSWANAYTTLQAAISIANTQSSVKEIRVASGVYTEPELTILGSYTISGSWNKLTNVQNSSLTPTVLDGQLQHRIMQVGQYGNVQLLMLQFTKGGNIPENGGAIYNKGVITMTDCRFFDNTMIALPPNSTTNENISNGGAFYNAGTAIIMNCQFSGNSSFHAAGAIMNAGTGELTITNTLFSNNVSGYTGGAIRNYGKLKLHNSRFNGNYLRMQTNFVIFDGMGGAICHQGVSAEIISCIFDKNRGHNGGAIYTSKPVTVLNSTFYKNESYVAANVTAHGAAIYAFYGKSGVTETYLYNNIFRENISKFNYNIYLDGIEDNAPVTGAVVRNNSFEASQIHLNYYSQLTADIGDNIDIDPLFVDPENGDFHLQAASPAIDAGNTSQYAGRNLPGSDYYGYLRISPCVIDLGAAEVQKPGFNNIKPDDQGILYVDVNSNYAGTDRGSSWSKALKYLSSATNHLNNCPSIAEIRVAGGLYKESVFAIYRGCIIRGGFNTQTGEQDWNNHPTILEPPNSYLIMGINAPGGKVYVKGFTFRNGMGQSGVSGGALRNSSELELTYCKFIGNSSEVNGGAIDNTGTLRVMNCTFFNNTATEGGAISSNANLKLTNCSFLNNTATVGQAIRTTGSAQTFLNNNIIWGTATGQVVNSGTIQLDNNIVRGVSGGIITNVNGTAFDQWEIDPLFTDEATGDLSLRANSKAVNKGKNSLYEEADDHPNNNSLATDKDLSFAPRAFGSQIDLGAYERQMNQQSITVTGQTAMYGDAPIDPGATASSSLPVSYLSADNNIAEAFPDQNNIWKVLIKRKGTVTIYANQPGNTLYDPALTDSFTLTIAPKPITVIANAFSKTYGDPDPVFTYSFSPALVPGDAFSNSPGRTPGEDVGTYTIQQGSLTPGDNYVVTFAGSGLTITPKLITVTAEAKSKTYGDPDPAFTYTFTPSLVNGDSFSGSLSRTAGENAGNYAINNGLSLSSNYTLVYAGSQFTINKRNITVSADNKSKTYGDPDPALTYTVSPALINGDVLTGALSRSPGNDAGSYAISQGNLDHGNYALQYTAGLFTIGKAAQQITWNQALASDCNGNTMITLNATSSSGLPVSYQSGNTGVATINDKQLTIVGPGVAQISASQAGDNNYLPAAVVQNTLTAHLPANLVVRHWDDVLIFDNSSRQYTAWQWYRNGQPVAGATGQYFHETGKLNGTYYAEAQNASGIMVPTCPLTITPGNFTPPLSISPNPAVVGQQVTVKVGFTQPQLQGARITIQDLQGIKIKETNNVSPQTIISMPLNQGLYVITLKLATGAVYSANVLVKP